MRYRFIFGAHHRCKARKVLFALTISVVVASMLGPPVLAAAISEGYHAKTEVVAGTLVSLGEAKDDVQPASLDNSEKLLGVVVSGETSTLAVSHKKDNIQVATGGTAVALVTDVNGPIRRGDQIAPSPIAGVGMKATDPGKIMGTAQADFDGTRAIKLAELTNKSGNKQTVAVGAVPVSIQVAPFNTPVKTAVPTFLQQFADTVAGKPVALIKLLIVGSVVVGAILLVTVLLFSAVRGAIISIGRNPLAQKSIYRGMLQVMVTSVVIMGIAVTGAYAILTY